MVTGETASHFPSESLVASFIGKPNVLTCSQAQVQLLVRAVERGSPLSGWVMQPLLLRSVSHLLDCPCHQHAYRHTPQHTCCTHICRLWHMRQNLRLRTALCESET